jgi:hypothetical protein
LVVKTTVPGFANNATCGSSIIDPLKANNSARSRRWWKAPLTVSRSADTVTISWPAEFTEFVLESADNLQQPIVGLL